MAVASEGAFSDTLSIWRLPSLEPFAEIDLEDITRDRLAKARWSPVGCHFAFSVPDDQFYSRLKLYSCIDNTISDIELVHQAAQELVTWSPDGKWLLYTISNDERSFRTSPTFLFAYSPQENLRIEIPIEALGFGYGIEWLSNEEAVIYPYPYEGDRWRVNYLSLETELPTMKVLYEDSFQEIQVNPVTRNIFVNPYSGCSLCNDSTNISLQIHIDSGEINPFEGEYQGGSNLPRYNSGVGIVKDDHWAFISNMESLVTTYEIAHNSVAPQASSDGTMILFRDDRHSRGSLLSTLNGETVRVLGNIEYATWLPNESEFLTLEPAGASQRLVRYRSETGWQAEVLVPHLGKFYHLDVVTSGL